MSQSFNIRSCGINPRQWYVVARSSELKDQPLSLTLWKEEIVLYRDRAGKVQALEDRCPHRQVKLTQGRVVGNQLECAYHGWQLRCCSLPCAEAKTASVQDSPLSGAGTRWLYLALSGGGKSRVGCTVESA